MKNYQKDIELLKSKLINIPKYWDGKESILELKEANYNWRQMEWWGFYFEHKARQLLEGSFQMPGEKINNIVFDIKGNINWDLKASAVKTHNQRIILNDCEAMDISIANNKYHGEIIALCDVEYNDNDRTFQTWHNEFKGGLSKYELDRQERNANSRYRKTKIELIKIIFLVIDVKSISYLNLFSQGRNSNGLPRNQKYMLDIDSIQDFSNEELIF